MIRLHKLPQRRRPVLTLATILLLPLGACAQETGFAAQHNLQYGASVPLGKGVARTYIVMQDGMPTELGVALSEAVMQDLPTDHTPGGIPMPDGHHTFDYKLELPEGNPTPFQFVGLDWNPAGHEPAGVYNLPHFDVHFYMQSEAERATIMPNDPQWGTKAGRYPGPEFLPQGYLDIAQLMKVEPSKAAVPMMGMHWVDPKSPELNGQRFTRTLIFGTWDGKLTFIEPMITKEYLESRPNFNAPLAPVQKYATSGYYPSTERIYWNAGTREYRVALAGFGKK